MNILIIGSGAYVLEDRFGPGVVLRSVLSWGKRISADLAVHLTANRPETIEAKRQYCDEIAQKYQCSTSNIDIIEGEIGLNGLKSGAYDAVFIAVPDQYHRPYLEAALKANCPAWIVKPLTGSLKDAEALVTAAGDTPKVWVDYHKRLDPSNQVLKAAVDDKRYGNLLSYQVDYQQPAALPLEDFAWASEVDPFTYIGCHYVDQIFYLYPDAHLKDTSATALKGKVYDKTGQPDMISTQLVFSTGGHDIAVSMQVGWCLPQGAPLKSQQRVVAQFEEGVLTLDQARRGIEVWDKKGVSLSNPYFFREYQDFDGSWRVVGYGYQSVARFLDLVHKSAPWPTTPPWPTLAEAVKTERVLAAVLNAL